MKPLALFLCCLIASSFQSAFAQDDGSEVPPMLEDGPPDQLAVVSESAPAGSTAVQDVDQFLNAYFYDPKQNDVRFPQHKIPVLIKHPPKGYNILIVITDVFQSYAEVGRFWYKRGDAMFPHYYNISADVQTTVYRVAAYFGQNITDADTMISSHSGLLTRHIGIVGVGRKCDSSICTSISTQMSHQRRLAVWNGNLTHYNKFSTDNTLINQLNACSVGAVTWSAVMKYARTSLGVAHFMFARNGATLAILRGDITQSQSNVMRAVRPGDNDATMSSCWSAQYYTTNGIPTHDFLFNLKLASSSATCTLVAKFNKLYVSCGKPDFTTSRWFLTLQPAPEL